MTRSSLLATSACACTMSIGAIVPISTRFWLSLSDCCDSASDSCCAFRLLIAYDRSQYAFRTLRSVCVMTPLELDVRELAGLLAVRHLLADLIDLEVAQQRLRELQVQVRAELRAEGAGTGSLVVNRELFQFAAVVARPRAASGSAPTPC